LVARLTTMRPAATRSPGEVLVRKLIVIGIVAVAVALPLLVQTQASAQAGARGQGAAAPQGGGGGRGGTLGPVNALGQEVKRPPVPTGPAPRLPDGTVDLNGLWNGGGPVNSIAQGLPKGETLPLLPLAKQLMDLRSQPKNETDDPHLWCMPMGVPRSVPYPFRFVQNYSHKAPTLMFILHEGNIHTYRQIFMDGRKHPAELDPTWLAEMNHMRTTGSNLPPLPGFLDDDAAIACYEQHAGRRLRPQVLRWATMFNALKITVLMHRHLRVTVHQGRLPADHRILTENVSTRRCAELLQHR